MSGGAALLRPPEQLRRHVHDPNVTKLRSAQQLSESAIARNADTSAPRLCPASRAHLLARCLSVQQYHARLPPVAAPLLQAMHAI
jgi:hypothetical protein